MEYKKLGSTNLKISRLAFGCWAIGGHGWGKISDQDSIAAIRQAWELGINFFDTADIYGLGHSEEVLSQALGKERKKAVIATKFGMRLDKNGKTFKDISPKWVVEALEASLRRLKVDCISLYQIHWLDAKTNISETMEALKKCQQAGKIENIGCSNFSLAEMRQAQEVSRVESLQAEYNLINSNIEKEILPYCQKKKMSVITYSPLAQGLFSGRYNIHSRFDKNHIRGRYENWQGEKYKAGLDITEELKQVGIRYNKTPAQTAIRWILDNPTIDCVISGIIKPEEIKENSEALGWELSLEDRKLLTDYADSHYLKK
ncbi:MAG: aldo/keto reductase [bacterium]